MNICIIPARGGSKRIPRKNIKAFHGKPIIAYSIDIALASGCFDKVIVSTDDREIMEVAKRYGAETPFLRPANISDDHATTIDVGCHAIDWGHHQGWDVSEVCCLYATAPLMTAEYLIEGYKKLITHESIRFVFSACKFSYPIQRALKLSNSGQVSMVDSSQAQVRSQDLEEFYHDAGQFYWGKKEAFLEKKVIFSSHSRMILMPRTRVQDIDTMEDWEFAETLFVLLNQQI